MVFHPNTPDIVNCTIVNNTTDGSGGGIVCSDSSVVFVNCIMWGNTAVVSGDIILIDAACTPEFLYCDFDETVCPDSVTCTGCLFDEDPLFVGGDPFDCHITELSPCIDMGTDDTVTYPDLPTGDIDGDARPAADGYDMGSDEVPCLLHGDVNFDGSVTAGDAQLCFNIVLGAYTANSIELCAADCNNDGTVTAGDAQKIFGTVLGMDSCVDPL